MALVICDHYTLRRKRCKGCPHSGSHSTVWDRRWTLPYFHICYRARPYLEVQCVSVRRKG